MSVLSWEHFQISIYRWNSPRGSSLWCLFRIGSSCLAFFWIFWATIRWEKEHFFNGIYLIYLHSYFYCSPWVWSCKCLLPGTMLIVWIYQAGFGPVVVRYHKLQILKIVTFLQVKIQQKQELTKYKPFINKNLWLNQYFK